MVREYLFSIDNIYINAMKISEIKDRWNTPSGFNKREWVINALKNNTSLEECIEKYNGKWDLRGIKLTTPQILQETLSTHVVSINDNTLEFKHINLNDIDFSYADLSYTLWTYCKFENLIMYSTNFSNVRLWACSMKNCNIEKTNLSGSLLGSRLKKNSGTYQGVVFKNSNFKNTAYSFPLFNNCSFIDCALDDVNFDGSRFENCIFKGKLYSPIFRGFTTKYEKRFFWERSINPYDFPNKMINVDFSDAQLYGVSFIDGVDISTCKLPKQGEYLLVNDLEAVYSQVHDVVKQEWYGEDKRLGLDIINNIYYTKHHKNQNQDIVDKAFLTEQFSPEFGNRFFELIKRINSTGKNSYP